MLPRSRQRTSVSRWETPEHKAARRQWQRSHPVRVARNDIGMTTHELGALVGVTHKQINRIERGEVTIAKYRGLFLRMAPHLSLDPMGLLAALDRWYATALNEPWLNMDTLPAVMRGTRNPLLKRAIHCWRGWNPVRYRREKAGFTGRELAERCGISYTALQRIEREGYVQKLPQPLLEFLSALGGIPAQWLQARYRAWREAEPDDETAAAFLEEYSHDGRNLLAGDRKMRKVRSRKRPQPPVGDGPKMEGPATGNLGNPQVRNENVVGGAEAVERVSPEVPGDSGARRRNPRPWYGRGV